jgi:hypothetical protein
LPKPWRQDSYRFQPRIPARLRPAFRRTVHAHGSRLALAQTLPSANLGLMNAAGHRANILLVRYGCVGINMLDGGR